MISSTEACQLVQAQLPELHCAAKPDNVYHTLQVFREYTVEGAREHNLGKLQRCFSLAAELYEKGSASVKCAVENVFVYSLSRIFSIAPEDKDRIKAIIPDSLRGLYMAQVLHHGY